jgi:hypothetical protein
MKSTVNYTTVAAQPGWFLAIFDSTNGVRYEQIIAWEIERTTTPRGLVSRLPIPITMSDNADLILSDWTIKRPDGNIVPLKGGMNTKQLAKFVHLIEIESQTEKLRVASPGIASGDSAMTSIANEDVAMAP